MIVGTNLALKEAVSCSETGPLRKPETRLLFNQMIPNNGKKKEYTSPCRVRVLYPNTDYCVRVVNGGIMSYKAGGQNEEAKLIFRTVFSELSVIHYLEMLECTVSQLKN
jgi:hypothetical protein